MWTVIGSSGSLCATRRTPPEISALAFAVAIAWSFATQDTCSRMDTMSNRNGFSPARWQAPRNVASCRWGEQAATTTRFRPSSWMSFSIISWPRLEHMNLLSRATTTLGRFSFAQAATPGQSTIPAILLPQ